MEVVLAIGVMLVGLAYAVRKGRHARRSDLSDEERADIRRARERALLTWKILMGSALAIAFALLAAGWFLHAFIMGLATLTAYGTVRYLQNLLLV